MLYSNNFNSSNCLLDNRMSEMILLLTYLYSLLITVTIQICLFYVLRYSKITSIYLVIQTDSKISKKERRRRKFFFRKYKKKFGCLRQIKTDRKIKYSCFVFIISNHIKKIQIFWFEKLLNLCEFTGKSGIGFYYKFLKFFRKYFFRFAKVRHLEKVN